MAFLGIQFYSRLIPKYCLVAIAGALIAGSYGVIHDQVTYSISNEYFTKFKFYQFQGADPGLESPRVFVGIIGFLATWWVGLVAGWMLARFAVTGRASILPLSLILKHFPAIVLTPLVFGFAGWGWGQYRRKTGYDDGWLDWMSDLQVVDQEAFMTVGYIHNFGYAGALVGLIIALLFLYRSKRNWQKKNQAASVNV